MTAVSPYVVPLGTVVDIEDAKMTEPEPLFVKTAEQTLEGGDDVVPKCKITIAQGIRPLLESMKLFGLYFSRESEDAGDVQDKKSRKWNKHVIYGAAIVILLWINVVRMLSVFTQEDKFGPFLFNKLIMVIWTIQCAVSQTAFYAASFSGRLQIVFRQVLDDSCAKHAWKFATVYSVIAWSIIMSSSAFFVYGLFCTSGLMDGLIAPFEVHISVYNSLIPRIIILLILIYLSAAYIFSQTMTFVLAMLFSVQFKKVIKTIGSCLDSQQRQVSDLEIETFRQKHQEIAMTVSHVDDCLMFSNASAFCCQLANFVVLLYILIFYHWIMTDPVVVISHVFWVFILLFGLTLTAAGGIAVHHYAHKISERVHDINLLRLHGEAIGKVNVFLSRLCGEPIGFTVLGIFVIDKNTILTLLGLLITYFLLIVQLSSTSVIASPASNATVTD